jgi:hypothetical protein
MSLLVISIISNCERKLTGWGDDADIYVLADSLLWQSTEPVIQDIFEKPIITPQDETIFTIQRTDLNNFQRYKNLLFLATLDGEGEVSQIVKNNLSPEAQQKVKEGNYVFLQKEKWASDQLIMFLVSTDSSKLIQKIQENQNYIFNLFDNYWNETKKDQMYRPGREKELEQYLIENYGWTFEVPYDYQIFIEKPDSNFVMLRRMLPERWLFVYWIENEDPAILSEKWVINTRDTLGKRFYEGDKVEQIYNQPDIEAVDFLGRRAFKIEGLWRNDIKEAGGPFRNYTFYDEPSQRIYMLDFAIFSPRLKRPKRMYLRQAEIILHTFRTEHEVKTKETKNSES